MTVFIETKNKLTPDLLMGGNVTVEQSKINRETYNRLSPLFKALIVSTTAGGKYNLKIKDKKMGFYFIYEELNLTIKVPLTALFNVNDKTRGILGIKWSSAKHCPSRALGFCQLPDTQLCYAHQGELQGSKKSYNYLMGMGSYLNSLLCIHYWSIFNKSPEVQETLKEYCQYYNIDTLRFNLSGDFKGLEDIKNLETLAGWGFLKLTGYTARDDLKDHLFKVINNNDNIILNGSNIMYNNRFKAVDNIETYFKAQYYCKGGCLINGCLNCYSKKGITIIVLIHGSKAGTTLNTPDNREFIAKILNNHNIIIKPEDIRGDIFRYFNKFFESNNLWALVPAGFLKLNDEGDFKFDGHNSFINYLRFLYDIKGGI